MEHGLQSRLGLKSQASVSSTASVAAVCSYAWIIWANSQTTTGPLITTGGKDKEGIKKPAAVTLKHSVQTLLQRAACSI